MLKRNWNWRKSRLSGTLLSLVKIQLGGKGGFPGTPPPFLGYAYAPIEENKKGVRKFSARFLAFPTKFQRFKNSAVLEPRTGQFSRTWGFEAKAKDLTFEAKAKDFKMCPRGLHLCIEIRISCRYFYGNCFAWLCATCRALTIRKKSTRPQMSADQINKTKVFEEISNVKIWIKRMLSDLKAFKIRTLSRFTLMARNHMGGSLAPGTESGAVASSNITEFRFFEVRFFFPVFWSPKCCSLVRKWCDLKKKGLHQNSNGFCGRN